MKLTIEIDDKEVALFLTKLRDIWNPPVKPKERSPEWMEKQKKCAERAREVLQQQRDEAKAEISVETEIKQRFKKKRTVSPERKAQLAEVCANMRKKRMENLKQPSEESENTIVADPIISEYANPPIIKQPEKISKRFCYKCQKEIIREYFENPKTHMPYHKLCYA